MTAQWWYLHKGQVMGPTGAFHLTAMLRNGTLWPADWVWSPDPQRMQSWRRIADINALLLHCRPDLRMDGAEDTRPPLPVPDPDAPRPAHPVRRLLAQGVDQLFGNMVASLLVTAAGLHQSELTLGSRADTFITTFSFIFFALLLQAFQLAFFGTTPGKRLLGLRVERADGTRPGLGTMLRRQLRLWVLGLGFGLHLLAPFTMAMAYRRLVQGQRTVWDEPESLNVVQVSAGFVRHPLAFLVYSATISVFINLPNGLHALTPSVSQVTITPPPKHAPPIPTLSRWTNPVTGKEERLVTGWRLTTQVLSSGGTAYVFWKADRAGRGMIYRTYATQPFAVIATAALTAAGQPVPTALPELTPDHPVCIAFDERIDTDDGPQTKTTRLCGFASGEVWHIYGWWPEQDAAEQSRVQALLDGLERTLW
ncbi:hypothetical protein CHU95_10655 [Niveispirillum lacus]|uniref:RDD domain-containing protein n=1 Tax=Niveispirillum lacus TaxID=1981099 RepID=A0A255YZ07_9PROT|nr:RDD family protein [Niveispirillum lacus]OYQ34483.1 hypothetical protein CHU95_10655 [Niveispirillum lacus]